MLLGEPFLQRRLGLVERVARRLTVGYGGVNPFRTTSSKVKKPLVRCEFAWGIKSLIVAETTETTMSLYLILS